MSYFNKITQIIIPMKIVCVSNIASGETFPKFNLSGETQDIADTLSAA